MIDDPDERLTCLFREHSPRVLAFLLRRGGGDAAPDLLSEVFAIAWQRVGDLPQPELPWLLGVARNTLAHHWRTQGQQAALALGAAHAAQRGPSGTGDVAEVVAERTAVVAALAALGQDDREVLLLVGWDGLSNDAAATVLGCAPGAFAVRLHRARRRLERALEPPPWKRCPPQRPTAAKTSGALAPAGARLAPAAPLTVEEF